MAAPKELFTSAYPAPSGKMPGQPEYDEEAPTPEEQDQYDQFVTLAINFMSEQTEPLLATLNNKDKPVFETVGETAVKIGQAVMGDAKAAGQQLSNDVIEAAGAEIVEHLMELADNGGILPFNQESKDYDETQSMALLHAAKVYGDEFIQSPGYNEEIKEDAGNFMAQGIQQEIADGTVAPGFIEGVEQQKAQVTQRGMAGRK